MQLSLLEEAGLQTIYSKIESAQNNYEKNVENNPNVFAKLEKIENDNSEIELSQWFHDLVKKVKLLRGIDVSFEEAKLIFEELNKTNYNQNLRKLAEIWILKGNWKYHVKKLLISDFYPTSDDLKDFKGQNFYFDNLHELIQDLKKYALILAKRQFKIYYDNLQLENKLTNLEYDKILTETQIQVGLMQNELNIEKNKNEEYLKRILNLEAKIRNLEEEF